MAGAKGKLASNKKEAKKYVGQMIKVINYGSVIYFCAKCSKTLPKVGMVTRQGENLFCNHACSESFANA